MNAIDITKRVLKRILLGCLLSVSVIHTANAAVHEVTAVFKPDPANPMKNKFKNTTAQSPICGAHMPARCEALNIISLRSHAIRFENLKPIAANHESVREGVMYKVPSEWRDVEIMEVSSGKLETVQVRIAGIGGGWVISRPPGEHAFGSSYSVWGTAPPPCLSSSYLASGPGFLTFFWIVPEGAGICSRTTLFDIPIFNQTSIDYAYEMKTPNPLDMPTGTYTGSIRYSIGPGMDFDFGDTMVPVGDSELVLNFTLDVQHALKVEIPPGGDQVELLPQGGWQAWLNQGRKPTRLFRDQTFNLSSSSRFKMNLECQYAIGNNCALWEANAGHEVPVEMSVTLPGGLTDAVGNPVNRRPLRRDGVGTELFQPAFYVERKPGTLHFEVARDAVEEMIKPNTPRRYRGNITVIWDSEVN